MKPLLSQFDTCHTAETTDQQALEDFGITQLLFHLKHYSDIDFDASQMHLTDAEVNAIAKLFIQQLTQSLNGKLIAGALNTLRHGEEIESKDVACYVSTFSVGAGLVTSEEKRNNNHQTRPYIQFNTQDSTLNRFPTPRYTEGDRVQWKTANPDWGVILGRFSEYNHHHRQWMVYYLIQLAPDSPSAGWVTTDTASEADLVTIPDPVESTEDNGNPYLYPTHSRHGIALAKRGALSAQRCCEAQNAPPSLHCPTGRYDAQRRHNPRPITQREKYIIDLYSYCELAMTPKQFYSKWDVTYEQLSHICSRSLGTVQCWFNRGQGYHPPQPVDLRHLAIMDFLLEHFEEIPQSLINLLCSS